VTSVPSLYRGDVVTMDPQNPRAEAFAVHDGRLIAVGPLDEVRAAVPGAAEHALDGVVLPGLIDAHLHMQRAGLKALAFASDAADAEEYLVAMRDSFHSNVADEHPLEHRVRALERVQPLLHALGFTGVIDPAVTIDELRGYQETRRRGLLTMRTVAMPYLEPGSAQTPDLDAVMAHLDGIGLSTGFGDEELKIGPIKVYSDGEALKGQALLNQPWDETGYAGLQRISEADFQRLVDFCAANGWGVGTHAVGGAAVAFVTRAYANAEAAFPGVVGARRHQLIHAYLEPDAETMALAARTGVIASLQPSLIWFNGRALRAKLGDRAESANPMRSWLDAGAVVALGSDGPFFSFDPRHLIWQVVTRRVADEEQPLSLAEAVSVEEALAGYTTGAAYASLAEDQRGMLRAGMLADWALWSGDPTVVPIDELRSLRVLRTDVGGRTVFTAGVSG